MEREIVGLVAGGLTTLAFLPQAVKVWRTRSTADISLVMFVLFCIGVALWLIYGAMLGSLSIILANAVTLVLALSILVAKIRFGNRRGG